MKIKLLLVLIAFATSAVPALLAGTGTAAENCVSFDLSSFPSNLPERENLERIVSAVLEAHCRCAFPRNLRDNLSVSWDPRFDTVDDVFKSPPECFGELSIGMVKVFDEAWIVHIILEPHSAKVSASYLAVEFSMQFVNGMWEYSWPRGQSHNITGDK